MRTQTALSNDQLREAAPSVFAVEAYEKMSDRYAFIPTISVVEKMRSEGFMPFSATQSRTRIAGKQEFTRHQIRFRDVRNGDAAAIRQLGEISTELILTNSHDGASAYKIDAGLFRLVCLNGMTVSDGEVSQINVRHSGNMDGIIDASYSVVEQFPKVLNAVAKFSQLQLTAPQQTAFAEAAISLRYEEGEAPITAAQVIRPRRQSDVDKTLWNTFNMVQENLINGGLRGRNKETHRNLTTRPVSGIAENTKLNKALWTLTERMRELVAN
jgi:hypothetical protein